MDITVHGLNVKIHDSLEDYARKKLDKLDRYLPGITDVRLDLSLQNTRASSGMKIAELTVRHRRGAILRAEERAHGEFEVAITQAVDKMYRRIERFKGKRATRRRIADKYVMTPEELSEAEAVPDATYAVPAPADHDGAAEEILRRKSVSVAAMTEDEAIEQMELLGHKFFIFFNPETNSVNVVYKRESGGYGLLVPNLE